MNIIQKVLAYLASWSLFWLGDWTSKLMFWSEAYGLLYPIYNSLMGYSSTIQDWANNKTPWGSYIEDTPEVDEDFRCQFWKKGV